MIIWISIGLVIGILIHEFAGKYVSGYRTVIANAGAFFTAVFMWLGATDWSAVVNDPKDLFAIMSAQSILTIYQQVRSDRKKS